MRPLSSTLDEVVVMFDGRGLFSGFTKSRSRHRAGRRHASACAKEGVACSSYYAAPAVTESPANVALMRRDDSIYLQRPFDGAPQSAWTLRRAGPAANHQRVGRLMGVMGLQAIHPWHIRASRVRTTRRIHICSEVCASSSPGRSGAGHHARSAPEGLLVSDCDPGQVQPARHRRGVVE